MPEPSDPEGTRLPIKLDSASNGEFAPIPLSLRNVLCNRAAHEFADRFSRRMGLTRRHFLVSSCGAASTLLAFNQVNAAAGKTGGDYAVTAAAAEDPEIAAAELEGKEFIFDVQGHFVNPEGKWVREHPSRAAGFRFAEKTNCPLAAEPGPNSHLDCIGPQEFVKDVFLDSDTDMMVLSFVPSSREAEPLTIEDADATRRIVAELEGDHRLLLHGRVNPNQEGDLEA
ncbi:MAG: amidohydrolase family protein, partial [Planctomycetaceae bacterium]